MDRLLLEDVRFYGHHGVTKAEQTVGVWFSVDVELAAGPGSRRAVRRSGARTVDYGGVARRIVELGGHGSREPDRAAGRPHRGDAPARVPDPPGPRPRAQADGAPGRHPRHPVGRAGARAMTPPRASSRRDAARRRPPIAATLGRRPGSVDAPRLPRPRLQRRRAPPAVPRAAYRQLAEMRELRVVDASPLYETEPWEREPGAGTDEQHWHLNCVIAVETSLSPAALLERMQAVEAALERERPRGRRRSGAPRCTPWTSTSCSTRTGC